MHLTFEVESQSNRNFDHFRHSPEAESKSNRSPIAILITVLQVILVQSVLCKARKMKHAVIITNNNTTTTMQENY